MRLRGWRKITYYDEILELPNVVLVHPSVATEEIMKKSSLVLTISGTSGLEALFYGKPSITFSDVSYSHISSVYRADNFEVLPELIKTALQKQVDTSELNNYVNLIKKNSFEFNLTGIYNKIYKTFYYNKFFFDNEISMDKLSKFLEKNQDDFTLLAFEHIKKIKQYNDNKLKGVEKKIE